MLNENMKALRKSKGLSQEELAAKLHVLSLCAVIVIIFVTLTLFRSAYLGWNFNDPETAVARAAFHAFECCSSDLRHLPSSTQSSGLA